MSVNVNKLSRPPALTGDWERDRLVLHDWMRDVWRTANQLRERTGGSDDNVSSALTTASTASTTASASQAGATVPTSGGSVTLDPENPLSYTVLTTTTAQIDVAEHTRSDAAATIEAGTAPTVTRGATYYVYYSDAGDAGGTVTFLASASLATVTGTAGYRIVGTIYVPATSFPDRDIIEP